MEFDICIACQKQTIRLAIALSWCIISLQCIPFPFSRRIWTNCPTWKLIMRSKIRAMFQARSAYLEAVVLIRGPFAVFTHALCDLWTRITELHHVLPSFTRHHKSHRQQTLLLLSIQTIWVSSWPLLPSTISSSSFFSELASFLYESLRDCYTAKERYCNKVSFYSFYWETLTWFLSSTPHDDDRIDANSSVAYSFFQVPKNRPRFPRPARHSG